MKTKILYILALTTLFTFTVSYSSIYATIKKDISSIKSVTQFEIYKNKRLGFMINIPKSWKGNYIIDDFSDGSIGISFIGKSKLSKNYSEESKKSMGLPMFYIGSESCVKKLEFIDSVQKIGAVKKIKFYYYTSTDYPLGALKPEFGSVSEKEKKLAEADYLKSQEMSKDIEKILKSFKAIK